MGKEVMMLRYEGMQERILMMKTRIRFGLPFRPSAWHGNTVLLASCTFAEMGWILAENKNGRNGTEGADAWTGVLCTNLVVISDTRCTTLNTKR